MIDQPLPLLYNDFAIVLGLVYGYLPLMILPLYASLERLNPEVLEAAEDLGSRPFRALRTVTLPLDRAPGSSRGACSCSSRASATSRSRSSSVEGGGS